MATRASPRPSHEVRELAIDAARQVFAAKGYAGASLREIAEKAGVAESLLYRNFKTKERLFQLAILEPIHGIFEGFVNDWAGDAELTNEELVEVTTRRFYALMVELRELLIALIAAETHEDGLASGSGLGAINGWMGEVTRAIQDQQPLRHLEGANLEVMTRIGLAATLGVGLFEPWLFPPGKDHPGREQILNTLIRFMQYGTIGSPPDTKRP